jgi:DNA-binding GntR family transcriptional regulator
MSEAAANGLQLDRGLLSDQIYAHIKQMIKTRALEPGQQVVESKLARELGVSQAPVREALKRLVHDGLVTHIPHHGNYVTEFSEQDAQDARMARVALEGMAARIACGNLSDEDVARLRTLIGGMRQAADRGDIGAFREADFAFHRAVIEMSRNVYLPRMWDIVEPNLRSLHVLSDPKFAGSWSDVADLHDGLLDALLSATPNQASKLFVDHASGRARLPIPESGVAVLS